MTPCLHRLSTWLVLVVALFAAMPPAAGVAVCFGHGGHVELGEAGHACPCDQDQGPSDSDGLLHGIDTHGPCHDVIVDPPETSCDGGASRCVFDGAVHAVAPVLCAPPAVTLRSVCRVDLRATCMPTDAGCLRSVVLLL